ncbi:tRNA uridine-5-carboxymethylaminomethyl(34) synthesis GTPase MnmE [Trichlorobacter lovleyi]|uniref:tRNA uridine-5-carboxymethylaminomethyl(34) synthesis GTPase MnmE n=1 Tax=Trichlorobacter lovleyi TaxID=313985 RepID=UPI00224088A1|nr:tRNA uridine-5-carboxymethylaminomethyl(34) synthesis GTPase MnmE [Trichlorobacter lovleyi]QOX80595.1 tRNA uridine-5-carboxymethylaminomethyl(34) synthesis GTPase MnmE [Trichlorobacter lovleyi]
MYIRDTIAAIATPLGSGGVGIVRVSGPDAEQIGRKVFKGSGTKNGGGFESHRLFYGRLINPLDGALIDEAMAVLMRAPRSYTREDVLELHCHGGYYVVRAVLEACIAAGARLAEAGEFTRRAFLNGRIDLAQAESVMDLIASRTGRSLSLAQSQREGHLSRALTALKTPLVDALALVEAHIDFPEDEVDPAVFAVIETRVASVSAGIDRLLASFATGKVLRDGVSVLLLGLPNAGKSSLLNALSGTDRAIVSALPGTTRDLIEETVSLRGLPVKVIDAAGIRAHHADCVEQEGVRRALDKVSEADLLLLLVDGTAPLSDELLELTRSLAALPYLLVVTKSDLPQLLDLSDLAAPLGVCSVSAKSRAGIDLLAAQIYDHFVQSSAFSSDAAAVISNVRHRDVLVRVQQSLQAFADNLLLGLPPELLALDLRAALGALGEITGETTTDDLLDLIFSSFCIGK